MKIATVVGARPQFVKLSMVSKHLRDINNVDEVIIHTGQHFDKMMSSVFFDEMRIPKPKYNLGINSLRHGAMIGRMLEKLESLFLVEKPDWVLVYGDTNSTLAGGLSAVKLDIPLAHVEAGLRSFNMRMPEEINRILTDRVSKLLFCPTETSVKNLDKEGIKNGYENRVVLSGDVMYDAYMHFNSIAKNTSSIISELGLEGSPFFLCTIHRPENTNNRERLESIFNALNSLCSNQRVVLPLHPRSETAINKYNLNTRCELIPPVSFLDMVELVKNCSLVLTDSGGLQKEAYFAGKFCVILRDETEWVELVDAGACFIAGAKKEVILSFVNDLMNKAGHYNQTLYGAGDASSVIVEELVKG
ncbi:MAG: UDP-N-acetylglucosamine 2-epimerase (non-hydrolyzing) [Candidatus Marinimicrobia bacterium]|nr:UDP-N-acetylglucosamine 2-epimerase (non-hydrolyzing) [Candidatus Neomarinimicrobiota bacterium]